MSQNYTCHHGKAWPYGQDPDCEPCRQLRLDFIRAALQGLCANGSIDESLGWRTVAEQAVRAADQAIRAAGAQR